MAETVLLKCENLAFGYGPNVLAAPMNFELHAGEVVALMGENGCGKSTLLKSLAGLIPLVQGTVHLKCDTDFHPGNASGEFASMGSVSPRELARRIALVRMSQPVPDRMTVREFVSLGRMPFSGIFDGRSGADERIVEESLSLLELEEFSGRWVASLSDGERSRVYLAEAVAQQAKILLLDEPNAFLDIPRSHKLFKLLQTLAQDRQMGIVVSTHSVEYALEYAHRIMVIHGGAVRTENADCASSKGLLDWTR